MSSTSVLHHGALSCLCGHPHRAGLCRCLPLPAGWGAAGTLAVSPLFLQLLGNKGALGQGTPWVSPACQCSLGGSCSHHGGMLHMWPYEAETPLPSWGGVPLQPQAALERAELAELLCPAVSNQHLPSPILTTAAALHSTAGLYLAASGQLGIAPRAGRRGKRQLGSHTSLSLPLPHAQATRRSGESPGDPAALHQAPREGAELPQCCECPFCLFSATRCFSRPVSHALPLTFHFFPLAQAMTLRASSQERLVEGQAKVRITRAARCLSPVG